MCVCERKEEENTKKETEQQHAMQVSCARPRHPQHAPWFSVLQPTFFFFFSSSFFLFVRVGMTAALVALMAAAAVAAGSAMADVPASWPPMVYNPATQLYAAAGNHRFALGVSAPGPVMAAVPWRRSDSDPLAKNSYVTDANNVRRKQS